MTFGPKIEEGPVDDRCDCHMGDGVCSYCAGPVLLECEGCGALRDFLFSHGTGCPMLCAACLDGHVADCDRGRGEAEALSALAAHALPEAAPGAWILAAIVAELEDAARRGTDADSSGIEV